MSFVSSIFFTLSKIHKRVFLKVTPSLKGYLFATNLARFKAFYLLKRT